MLLTLSQRGVNLTLVNIFFHQDLYHHKLRPAVWDEKWQPTSALEILFFAPLLICSQTCFNRVIKATSCSITYTCQVLWYSFQNLLGFFFFLVMGSNVTSLMTITDLILGSFIWLWWYSSSFQSPGTCGSLHTSPGPPSNPHVSNCKIPRTST